jgi:signal transduction histidine kinase
VWGHGEGPDFQRVRFVAQRIEFPVTATSQPNDTRTYTFMVAGSISESEAEVDRFNGTLIWSFAFFGAGLIGAIFFQVRIGLRPLHRVAHALARIREGTARRLEGNFPAEIAPLATELNSLIEHSAEVVGRARTHVSNLAHFLKTPLTVLGSEASAQPGPLADAVLRQVTTMRRQVDHYLARARAAGAVDALGNRTPVKSVLDDIARVLTRIHRDRGLEIVVDCSAVLAFRGERQDLEEMTGNLVDNACKWAKSKVLVSARRIEGARFELRVGDDGPGLDPIERTLVGERGERLDESVPGSGLGLAIVRDIAKLYGGTLELAESRLGGLEARLILPAIQ